MLDVLDTVKQRWLVFLNILNSLFPQQWNMGKSYFSLNKLCKSLQRLCCRYICLSDIYIQTCELQNIKAHDWLMPKHIKEWFIKRRFFQQTYCLLIFSSYFYIPGLRSRDQEARAALQRGGRTWERTGVSERPKGCWEGAEWGAQCFKEVLVRARKAADARASPTGRVENWQAQEGQGKGGELSCGTAFLQILRSKTWSWAARGQQRAKLQ